MSVAPVQRTRPRGVEELDVRSPAPSRSAPRGRTPGDVRARAAVLGTELHARAVESLGGGIWISRSDRVDRLTRALRRDGRFALAADDDLSWRAPRLAIDPGTGRVASDDGRIARSFGGELVPVVEFGREIWNDPDELPLYQDRTTDVVWAFGRAVIARDAPGIGLTVIEPFE